MECLKNVMRGTNNKHTLSFIKKSNYYIFNSISLLENVIVLYYIGHGEDDSSPFNDILRYGTDTTENFYNHLVKLYLYYLSKKYQWYHVSFLKKLFKNRRLSPVIQKINEFRVENFHIRDNRLVDIKKYIILLPNQLKKNLGIKHYTSILQKVIDNAPPTPGNFVVVRGTKGGGNINVGDVHEAKGFTSTTWDINRALKYLKTSCCFNIVIIPEGTKCIYHKAEKQLILNPGSNYVFGVKILEKEQWKGRTLNFKTIAKIYSKDLNPTKVLAYDDK